MWTDPLGRGGSVLCGESELVNVHKCLNSNYYIILSLVLLYDY